MFVVFYRGEACLRSAPVGAKHASSGRIAPLALTKKPVSGFEMM